MGARAQVIHTREVVMEGVVGTLALATRVTDIIVGGRAGTLAIQVMGLMVGAEIRVTQDTADIEATGPPMIGSVLEVVTGSNITSSNITTMVDISTGPVLAAVAPGVALTTEDAMGVSMALLQRPLPRGTTTKDRLLYL